MSDEIHAAIEAWSRARILARYSNQQLHLIFGELTSQEIRTIKATLNHILNAPQDPQETRNEAPPR